MAEMSDNDDFQRPLKRFRKAVTSKEEADKLSNAIPKATRYKNNWAFKIFQDWKNERRNKLPELEQTSLDTELESVESLEVDFEKMTPKSLDFWIGKFLQEVADKNGNRYPGPTLYQIVAGLKRHLEAKHRRDVNMLDKNNSW